MLTAQLRERDQSKGDEVESPLVSICCITYNHANFIKDALQGFLMQKTNFSIEILIHDDASADGTEQIIRDYERKYPGIIKPLYETENQYVKGRKGSRTFNFPRAKGKYIAMCEGDDYWIDSLKLQKQVDFLEANPTFSGTFHETRVTIENNDQESGPDQVYGANAPDICTVEDTFSTHSLFHTSSFLFRRSHYILPDWHNKVISADMALFSIVAGFGPIKKIPGIMSIYRKHGGGVTSSPDVINNFHQGRIDMIKLLNAYHNHEYSRKAEEIINYHLAALRKKPMRKPTLLHRIRKRLALRQRLRNLFT